MNRKIQISVHILHKAALTWTASTLQDHSFVVGWVNLFVEFIKLWFQLDYNSTVVGSHFWERRIIHICWQCPFKHWMFE